jgi:chemotaxis protein CheX
MSVINPNLAASQGREAWAPLLELAACEVFERMLGSHLVPAQELFAAEENDVASMVGLAGQMCGVMTIRCSTKAALLMASKMLGVDSEQSGPEMWDAVGEVCNMVAGNFKNKIDGMGDGCMLSVPTVIMGTHYSLHALVDSGKTEVHLVFDGLPLVVSLEVHS